MIKITNAGLLAVSKLRAHFLRTVLTMLLASILFGALIAASLIMNGLFTGLQLFREDGLNGRYLVRVSRVYGGEEAKDNVLKDPMLVADAKRRHKQLVAEKTAEAKKLNIAYDSSNDRRPTKVGRNGYERMIRTDTTGIVQAILTEKFGGQQSLDDNKLQEVAKKYGAKTILTERRLGIAKNESLEVFKDGKEEFKDSSEQTQNRNDQILASYFTMTPSEIASPFMLPDQGGWRPNSGMLPIMLTQEKAERLMGMSPLPSNASADDKLARLKEVRHRAKDFSFQACYRNSASLEKIESILADRREMEVAKNDPKYKKPSLIYALPDPTRCENPTVQSDTRNKNEKKQAQDKEAFDKKFGKNTEMVSRFIKFKLVGILPGESSTTQFDGEPQARNISDLLQNVLKTNGFWQMIPEALYEQIPDKSAFAPILTYTPQYFLGPEDNKNRYIEFADSKSAQKFIDEQGCTVQSNGSCSPKDRPYAAEFAFSNSSALDELRHLTQRWFSFAMIGVTLVAVAVMLIAIGRTISDGRRETAIFRAIGFTRADIGAIYVMYTILLTLGVIIFALAIGMLLANVADSAWAPGLTAQAQFGFGALDLTKKISLFEINVGQISGILIVCALAGIVSMAFPLMRGLRRNPINDLKRE